MGKISKEVERDRIEIIRELEAENTKLREQVGRFQSQVLHDPLVVQWEYLCLPQPHTAVTKYEMGPLLSKYGEEGWELVAVTQENPFIFWLKRRKRG